ncbi:MAG: hypothetical protein ACK41Q_11510 [Candidatus Brocadia sp.]
MLNEYQKRGLSITLRIVEKTMQDIEHILHNGTYTGILYDMKCSISPEAKKEFFKRASLIKDRIKIISRIFDLQKEHREALHEIFGKLPHCLEIVEDVKAEKLKRYGDVSYGLDKTLDPQLNIIIDLILEMQRLLR